MIDIPLFHSFHYYLIPSPSDLLISEKTVIQSSYIESMVVEPFTSSINEYKALNSLSSITLITSSSMTKDKGHHSNIIADSTMISFHKSKKTSLYKC